MPLRLAFWICRYKCSLLMHMHAGTPLCQPTSVLSCLVQNDKQQRVCYAASHMVVISNHDDPHQTVLQGHCQPVSCLATSKDRSVVASADTGPNSLIVLWDAQTATPFWSVSKPHPYGIAAMQLSPDGRQLVALSAIVPGGSEQQLVSLWDVSSPAQSPVFSAVIPAGEPKHCLCLSPDGQELITNGKSHVCFWQVTSSSVQLATSPTRAFEFTRDIGAFTVSNYLPNGIQVMLTPASYLSHLPLMLCETQHMTDIISYSAQFSA